MTDKKPISDDENDQKPGPVANVPKTRRVNCRKRKKVYTSPKKIRSLLTRLVKTKKNAEELEKLACIKAHLRNMIILPYEWTELKQELQLWRIVADLAS
ncbi:30S ribosomal protein S19 [Aphelenchoides besseyi]|nr:30S ribosomal protein S19 [Aphelenchoides besseyi]